MNRALAGECLGTAALLAVVIGSGIMGEQLAGGNAAVALLANSIATGAALFVLIVLLAPVSGAHFNPVVTLAALRSGEFAIGDALARIVAQVVGAIAGVLLAHAMFALALVQTSMRDRSSPGEFIGEVVATSGLLLVIRGSRGQPVPLVAALVALYITAAYWFTSSTSFANPAVSIARSLTDTFAGIAPASLAVFIPAQLAAIVVAAALGGLLFAKPVPAPADRRMPAGE